MRHAPQLEIEEDEQSLRIRCCTQSPMRMKFTLWIGPLCVVALIVDLIRHLVSSAHWSLLTGLPLVVVWLGDLIRKYWGSETVHVTADTYRHFYQPLRFSTATIHPTEEIVELRYVVPRVERSSSLQVVARDHVDEIAVLAPDETKRKAFTALKSFLLRHHPDIVIRDDKVTGVLSEGTARSAGNKPPMAADTVDSQAATPSEQLRSNAIKEATASLQEPELVELIENALSGDRAATTELACMAGMGEHRMIQPLVQLAEDEGSGICESAYHVLRDMGPPVVNTLIEQLKDMRSEKRETACRVLRRMNDPRVLQHLMDRMGDLDIYVRQAAIVALLALTDGAGIAAQLSRMLKDSRVLVRESAVRVLGGIDDRQATKALIDAIDDDDSFVRLAVAEVLRSSSHPGAEEVLDLLLLDTDPQVRGAACEALGSLEGVTNITPLIQCLADAEAFVRSQAAMTLSRVGDESHAEFIAGLLGDESESVRESAREGVVALLADPVPLFLSKIRDRDPIVRCVVCSEFTRRPDARALESLLERVLDDEEGVRAAACEALGKLGSREATSPLTQALHDSKPKVRAAACRALGEIGEVAACEHLTRRTLDDEPEVRAAACGALGALQNPDSVEHLIAKLEDANWSVRASAADALTHIPDSRSVGPLMRLLEDDSPLVRDAACQSLGQLGDRKAVDALLRRLGDAEPDVRQASLAALLQLGEEGDKHISHSISGALSGDIEAATELGRVYRQGDHRSFEALLVAMEAWDAGIRANACVALGHLGDAQVVEHLLRKVADGSASVRAAACEALHQVGETDLAHSLGLVLDHSAVGREKLAGIVAGGDMRALAPLLDCLESPTQSLRVAARAALMKINQQLEREADRLLCRCCLTRLTATEFPKEQGAVSLLACRTCASPHDVMFGIHRVICILDHKPEASTLTDGDLDVTWSSHKTPFDFDEVQIINATDEEVERFVVAIANDTDGHRRRRYKEMNCTVDRQCQLSENTSRILRTVFDEIAGLDTRT